MSFTFTRASELTDNIGSIELPMSELEFEQCYVTWCNGVLIQNAFPTLNADQREFIKTGITADEWCSTLEPNNIFPTDEEGRVL